MATKLLLIEDVEGLGRSGDIVAVKSGYARNFLVPQGFAVLADKQALLRQKQLQEERQARAVQDKQEAEGLSGKLNGATVAITVKVDPEGHMYGSVSAHDVVTLIQEQLGIEIDKRYVVLKHALRETGVHALPLHLKEGVECSVTLKIEPDHVVEG